MQVLAIMLTYKQHQWWTKVN